MLRIFKYQIEVQDIIKVEMPKGARILTVQSQYNVPCIWAIIDDDRPLEVRCLQLFGTGQRVNIDPVHSRYIGTFQLWDGQFIGHLFEPAV